jgi:hypothetical protein
MNPSVYWMLLGCSTPDPSEDGTTATDNPTVETPDSELQEDLLGEVELNEEELVVARRRVRMNVSQLNQSMQQISGVEWKSGNTVLWERYSSTLGVPDFEERTSEDLEASVIFQKFLQDAATYTCEHWIDNESEDADGYFYLVTQTDEQGSSLVRPHIEDLRYLVHGVSSGVADVFVENVWDLHQLVYQRTENPVSAWQTVCVAMFTHPDFYTY